jgi:hypothetical protein
MATPEPAPAGALPICDQCGEPISPSDSYRALEALDADTGEPTAFSGQVIHERCWDAWDGAHEPKA